MTEKTSGEHRRLDRTADERMKTLKPGALEVGGDTAEEELSVVYDALNSAASGVIITNLRGHIIYVNPAFLRIFEYNDKDEVLGKNAAQLFATESVKKFTDVQAIIDQTRGETEEFTARHKDGRTFPVEVSSSNVTDKWGRTVGRMASFIDITERKKAEREIKYLSRRLIETAEEERKKLSRDLHDECGQILGALHIGLETLQHSLKDELVSQKKKIEELIGLIQNLGETIRNISHELRPGMLDDLGLVPTLQWFVKDFSERNRIEIEFQVVGLQKRLASDIEIVLYRITQEGLTNVIKHARANHLDVTLTASYPTVILTLRDDGVGFDADWSDSASDVGRMGIGFLGMRERVASVRGTIDIRSRKGKGTLVRVELPLRWREQNG